MSIANYNIISCQIKFENRYRVSEFSPFKKNSSRAHTHTHTHTQIVSRAARIIVKPISYAKNKLAKEKTEVVATKDLAYFVTIRILKFIQCTYRWLSFHAETFGRNKGLLFLCFLFLFSLFFWGENSSCLCCMFLSKHFLVPFWQDIFQPGCLQAGKVWILIRGWRTLDETLASG